MKKKEPDRRRGRPRSAEYEEAILAATYALLAEKGYHGFSIEDIVQATGVARTTIYRRWPDKASLAMQAILTQISPYLDFDERLPFAEAMKKQMKGLAGVFQGDNGRVIASVIGAAQEDEQLAKSVREDYLKPRRRVAHDFIKGAIRRAEFPESSEAEIEGFIDLLYGGLYFRLLLKHKRPGLDGLERWIDLVFAALKK